VVTAIILWNTVYLDRAVAALGEHGIAVDRKLLGHLSPVGWEHINLTGDYVWRQTSVLNIVNSDLVRLLAARNPVSASRQFAVADDHCAPAYPSSPDSSTAASVDRARPSWGHNISN